MADETISEKCETLYNKLNSFVASVISRDVTPKISNLNTEVWGSDTQTGNSRIDTLNTNFNNLDSSITTMESDINNVESDVSNLQTSVNSLNTSITNIGTFEKVAENTTYELWVNTTTRCARIICHRTNITIGSGENFNNYGDFTIPSAYRPKKSFYRLIMRSNQFIFYLYDNGSYGIYNLGSSVSGYSLNFQIDYTFQMFQLLG